jgi:ABC-type phosphate transport system permease subunit
MDVIESTRTPADAQEPAGAVGPLPAGFVGPLWLIIVSGLVVFALGNALAVYLLLASGKDPKDVVPLVTAVVGVLAGLLAPSPVARQ